MKKSLVLLFLALSAVTTNIYAQTASPSAYIAPTSAEDKQVTDLKNKVADKVKELTKENQTATSGYITEYKGDVVKFKSVDGTTSSAKIDSVLTKVYQVSGTITKEVKTTALTKGVYIIVSGPSIGDVINANAVYLDEHFEIIAGKLIEVDTANAKIKVTAVDKETFTVDIETSTKLMLVNSKTFETERTTMAKLKEGDTVQVIYSYDPAAKDHTSISASRVLVIPQEYFAK